MMAEASAGHVALLTDDNVRFYNAALASMYQGLATNWFAKRSDDELRPRIRAYDNNQRFTFGRAQTARMAIARLLSGFDLDWLQRLDFGQPDLSFFPVSWSDDVFIHLADVIDFSLQELVPDSDVERDEAMVTVFAHRTLVRPGESYPGFFHHDLFPPPGRIGTAVWYPTIGHKRIEGAELYAYLAPQEVSLDVLREREPDLKFPPDTYENAVMIMRYPHNAPHGVTPGVNPYPVDGKQQASLRDFIEPGDHCFVKDLVIITVSDRSPVEQ